VLTHIWGVSKKWDKIQSHKDPGRRITAVSMAQRASRFTISVRTRIFYFIISHFLFTQAVWFMQLGCRVTAGAHTGIARYIGPAKFASGDWVGIELDTPDGKNDGTVNGEQVRC
jgi:hypothetical protein